MPGRLGEEEGEGSAGWQGGRRQAQSSQTTLGMTMPNSQLVTTPTPTRVQHLMHQIMIDSRTHLRGGARTRHPRSVLPSPSLCRRPHSPPAPCSRPPVKKGGLGRRLGLQAWWREGGNMLCALRARVQQHKLCTHRCACTCTHGSRRAARGVPRLACGTSASSGGAASNSRSASSSTRPCSRWGEAGVTCGAAG